MPKFTLRDTADLSDIAYQHYILQGVSRTFALTIPQLPLTLRNIVGNGYLLCRIADTIEDDPNISIANKTVLAQQFIAICNGQGDIKQFVTEFSQQLSKQTPPAEIDLIQNTQRIINIMRSFTAAQQKILARCVHIMLEGMIHFQANASLQGLTDLNSMNSYCYHVAGVVGEMLTALYSDYSSDIAVQENTLIPLSISFGQGLQMTNILKDIWTDQSRNMCWLPQDIFSKYDIELDKLDKNNLPANFAQAIQELVSIASAHLHNAMRYTLLIPKQERGLRLFSLWAIGMALLSLRKISQTPCFNNGQQVKISRRSVSTTILITKLIANNNTALQCLFNLLSRTLPKPAKIDLAPHTLRCDTTLSIPH